MILTAMVIFAGGTLWTIVYSFTNSRLLPRLNFVGVEQYERLWSSTRWIISIQNLFIYGICMLIFSLVIGFILAALLDQKIRFENTFRSIFLYPFALSFIVTGLVWQWLLDPDFGLQGVVRKLGWTSFTFDPLYNSEIVIYGILIAALWQGTGLVMCLMLAGLRGIDEDIWKAARVDGIPMWEDLHLHRDPHDARRAHHLARADRVGDRQGLRPRRRPDRRGARHRVRSAGQICLRHDVPGTESRPGLRCLHHDAAFRADRTHPLGLS